MVVGVDITLQPLFLTEQMVVPEGVVAGLEVLVGLVLQTKDMREEMAVALQQVFPQGVEVVLVL